MTDYTRESDIDAIVAGVHGAPLDVLGPHLVQNGGRAAVVIRAFLPQAQQASVYLDGAPEDGGSVQALHRVHPAGFFEAAFPDRTAVFPYRLGTVDAAGCAQRFDDPYAFPTGLTDYDLHLIGEGTHYRTYEKLGAHLAQVNGVGGVRFAVWAPNAAGVSVVGDFNDWDNRSHPMQARGGSGVWELFIPGLSPGTRYKYHVRSRVHGFEADKADPYGFAAEVPPGTASVVASIDQYEWHDQVWLTRRAQQDPLKQPLAIYEVHPGSWRRVPEEGDRYLTYRELAEHLIPYVKEMGYTHIQLLPISEHPFDGSWGYQPVGYFAPTSRYGAPEEFMGFVDRCHQHGIGVLLDWVPAHFPKDIHGLNYFDGTHLYEHADPRKGEHPDWGTLIFNFGRNEVSNFLLSNALFWLREYHVDGLRVDAVASMLYLDYSREAGGWLPNEYGGRENLQAVGFLKRFNELVHAEQPGVLTIAEESTAWPQVSRPTYLGGLGFSLKWNMGWMHDTLRYMARDPIHRRYHQHDLTFSLIYAFNENFVLPLSHDEVVHGKGSLLGKMPGDDWQAFANLRAFYGYMYGHPGKKLLFMGGEIGQRREWNYQTSLDWHLLDWPPHHQLQRYVRDMNHLYAAEPALFEVDFHRSGFEWIDLHDVEQSVIAFVRRAADPADFIVFVCNFTPEPRLGYRIGVPAPGYYRELLNSDSELYGGSNVGNAGGVPSEPVPFHHRAHSVVLTLPPLSTVVLKRVGSR